MSDVTDNYAASFSGSGMTSSKTSEPSTWSLLSAASTSTSSFYPACASSNVSKSFGNENATKLRQQQQQQLEVPIKSANGTDGDSEIEKAQTIEPEEVETSKSLPRSEPTTLVEKLHSLSEENRLHINTNTELDETEGQIKNLLNRIDKLEAENKEQKKTIAKLKEETVNQKVMIMDGDKERDSLLLRNASLFHQMEYEKREWSIEREQLSMQVDDITRELELQKMLLNSESISEIVQRWENKVFDLKGMIYDRDRAIRAQQQRISELIKSPPTFNTSNFLNIKRAVLQFLTNRNRRNSDQYLKALSVELQLSSDEEASIRRSNY